MSKIGFNVVFTTIYPSDDVPLGSQKVVGSNIMLVAINPIENFPGQPFLLHLLNIFSDIFKGSIPLVRTLLPDQAQPGSW